MAQFKFQLQPLLKHRERAEQERQRDLAVVNAELSDARAELRKVEQTVLTAVTDLRENRLTGPVDVAFLTAHRRFMTAMERQGADRAARVAAAQAKVDAAQKLVAEAAKQRKAIETLRDQQHERWRQDQGRREAAAGDEIAMQMASEQLNGGPYDGQPDGQPTEDGR